MLDGYPLCDLPREKPLIPHEQDILADFVTILGGDPVLTNGSPLTTAQVIEIIHSRGGALAKFEDHHAPVIVEIVANNARRALDYRPGRFHGNLLLFKVGLEPPHHRLSPRCGRVIRRRDH